MSIKKIYNEIILVWNESTQSYDTIYEDSYLHDGEVYEMMPRDPLGDIEKMVRAGKGKGSGGDDVPKNKFDKHIFVCINSREDINKASCGEKGFAIRTALVKELASHPNIGKTFNDVLNIDNQIIIEADKEKVFKNTFSRAQKYH